MVSMRRHWSPWVGVRGPTTPPAQANHAPKQVRLKLIKTTLVTIQSSTAKLSGSQSGVVLA
jgi:hypothetical protein